MPDATRRSRAIAALVALALTVFAFRDLFARGLASADAAVFAVAPLPGVLIVAVALWYGWRRVRIAQALEPGDARPLSIPLGLLLLLLAILIFSWARAIGDSGLQFAALSFLLLGFASLQGGAPLARRLRAPAGLLLLGLSIPRPIEDEIVWALQRWTALGANAVLNALGIEFKVAGVILRDGTHKFHVIDSCCGLTGILILIVVAIIVRELFELGKLRSAMLLVATIGIGWVVNVLRVAYVASRPNPEELAGVGGDHTLQGVAVLAVGTAAVYAIGLLLEWQGDVPPSAQSRSGKAPGAGIRLQIRWPVWSAIGVVVLASLLVADGALLPVEDPLPVPVELDPPVLRWRSEEAPAEPYFNGRFAYQFHRRFTRRRDTNPLGFVDVFVGQGRANGEFSTRGFSSKRFYPGPDWNLVSRERRMVWALGSDVDTSVSAPNAQREHAVLYVWKTGDRGLAIESLRALVGLDRLRPNSSFAEPVLVKLTAYARSGRELRLSEAETRLEEFIHDHAAQFAALRDTGEL